jgi:uncharacterized protein YabN with tetrapyrrole methylase and pyrophosphatase domain
LEVKEAIANKDLGHIKEEIGDLLDAICQTSRHLKIDPEIALYEANNKFEKRFMAMTKILGNAEKLKELNVDQQLEI